jgi:6-phosphogluconolactonase
MPLYVYVGAYTGPGRAEGISVFQMNGSTGALAHVQTLAGIENPSFLALHPQRPYLYAVNEVASYQGQPGGAVSAFGVDTATGRLSLLNQQASHGTLPCHLSLDPSGAFVLVANYGSGSLAVLPVQEDGRLGPATDVVQHAGRGPHPRRQEGPHAHFITPDPAGAFILACDLGIDRIMIYRLDHAQGKLVANEIPYGQVSSGAGPRHLAFHPSGRYAYVINELDSTVSAFAYDGARGALQVIQTVSTLPPDFHGANTCAHVLVHGGGRFLYGSNRGHDSIAIFAIDQDTGRLSPVGHEPTRGRTPRNFNVDPSGAFLLAANQNSNSIVTFRIDPVSGRLAAAGPVTESPAPVCIQFGQFE